MYPEDRCAALEGRDGGGDARAAEIVAVDELAERALAREADQHRAAEREEHVEAPDELEVVLERLAEADARIKADAILTHAALDREPHAVLEERRDLACNVVVTRIVLHRPRLTLHVHEADIGVVLGAHVCKLRIGAECRDVVHELGAERECAAPDLGLRSVDRHWNVAAKTL